MNQYDFYTGQPMNGYSPNPSGRRMPRSPQERIAAVESMPTFNPYANLSQQQAPQQPMYNNYNPYQNAFNTSPYYNPNLQYQQQQQGPRNPINTPQFSGYGMIPQNNNYCNNFNYGYNRFGNGYQQPKKQYHDKVVHIDGYLPTGVTVLWPTDLDNILEKIQREYNKEIAEIEIECNYQPGYYNFGFYTRKQKLDQELRERLDKIRVEAKERAIDYNKKALIASEKVCGTYTEETEAKIDRFCRGYDITITAEEQEAQDEYDELARLVPDHSLTPYQIYCINVHNYYKMLYDGCGDDLNEFFRRIGLERSIDLLVEEEHKRRNDRRFYDRRKFSEGVSKKHKEMYGKTPEEEFEDKLDMLVDEVKKYAKECDDADRAGVEAPDAESRAREISQKVSLESSFPLMKKHCHKKDDNTFYINYFEDEERDATNGGRDSPYNFSRVVRPIMEPPPPTSQKTFTKEEISQMSDEDMRKFARESLEASYQERKNAFMRSIYADTTNSHP